MHVTKFCNKCPCLQSGKMRAQFISNQDNYSGSVSASIQEETKEDNNNRLGSLRGGRPPQSVPANSLASATRIINHHLFGSTNSPKHNTGNWTTPYQVSRSCHLLFSILLKLCFAKRTWSIKSGIARAGRTQSKKFIISERWSAIVASWPDYFFHLQSTLLHPLDPLKLSPFLK